ncbi:MAG: hypothetical protein ABIR87_00815 [Sphingomicrobium sp.]
MKHFWAFLIIATLLLGQGFSASAAMCVHRTASEHARALESRDGSIAVVAQNEDSAASLIAKKAASSGAEGLNLVAHLAAPPMLLPLRTIVERVTRSLADGPALSGISTTPLLRPPLAIM